MADFALRILRHLVPALFVWAAILALRALVALLAGGPLSAIVAPFVALLVALTARRQARRMAGGVATDMMHVGGWIFAGAGGFFALVGAWVARAEAEGWAMVAFGLVFVAIGRLVEYLAGGKPKPGRVEPAPKAGAGTFRVPGLAPMRRLRAAGLAAAAAAALGLAFLSLGAFGLGALLVSIAGALGWRVAGGLAAARKFPEGALRLDAPLRGDAPVTGWVETGAPPEMFGDGRFLLRLECLSGGLLPRPLWSRSAHLQVTEVEAGAPVLVPFAFDPPHSLPGAGEARWRLHILAEAPGADYEARFDIPAH